MMPEPNTPAVDEGAETQPRELLVSAEHMTRDAVAHQPWLTVAAAFGVGTVLGGGLPNWAVGLLVRNGARAALAYALAQTVDEGTS